MINVNTYDKETANKLTELESKVNGTIAETFIIKNIDEVKNIVVYPTGTGRAIKLFNNELSDMKDKNVSYYDNRGSFVDSAKEYHNTNVKFVNSINELYDLKDVDAVVSINEANKQFDIKTFLNELLLIPAKKYFIVLPKLSKSGQSIDKVQVETINNSTKKVVNNIYSYDAIEKLALELDLTPITYTERNDGKPDPDNLSSNCVVLVKQIVNKKEEKEIKKEVVDLIMSDKPKNKKNK